MLSEYIDPITRYRLRTGPGNDSAPQSPTGAVKVCDAESSGAGDHSHSMVPGGLLVMSTTTRFTSGTSLVMRVEMISRVS